MPPALTRKQKQAKTRSALLDSASKIFCRHGLANASVEQVAEEAGYTKGAFYANFKSKEELFLVMLDEKFAAELERIDGMLAGGDDPGEEAREATEDVMRFAYSDPEWPRLFFEFTAYAGRDENFRQELATRCRAMDERLAEILKRWSADFPVEPPLPLADIATISSAMANGFMMQRMIEPEQSEELAGTTMAIFFLGLQAMASGWQPPPKTSAS
jgi:AcrR family transcriptional regulator